MIKDWNDPEYCLEAVKRDACAIRFVKNQTPKMCLQADYSRQDIAFSYRVGGGF